MVKNPSSNSGDMGSIPSWGTKIPYALGQLRPGEVKNKYILKKKRKNDELFLFFGWVEGSHINGKGYPSGILAWRIPWTEEPGGL